MVGDDQGGETDQARCDQPDASLENALQNDPHQHRPPADEDGRGIQIGDRRPALQKHSEPKAESMNDKSQDQQRDPGAAKRLGEVDPKSAAQQDGGDVDDHPFVERLGLVEEKFLAAFLQLGLQAALLQPSAIAGDRPVEGRRVARPKRGGHCA